MAGFHSYVNLTDAINRCNKMNIEFGFYPQNGYCSTFHVFEVDTDEILAYGVEGQKDIVVSRKIRFIQQII